MNAHDKPNAELGELYRSAGDIEPGAQLDRIIRARAAQAAERSRPRRHAWLGGLATASVAVLAVTIAIRQPAPVEGEAIGPPSAPRQASPPMPAAERAPNGESKAATSADAGRYADPQRVAPAPAETDRIAEPAAAAQSRERLAAPATDRSVVTGSRIAELEAAGSNDGSEPEAPLIAQLRALIEAGKVDQARRLLERARADGRDIALPEDLVRQLRPGDPPSGAPGGDPDGR